MSMGTAQQRLINLKASPKKPKEREMNEEMVIDSELAKQRTQVWGDMAILGCKRWRILGWGLYAKQVSKGNLELLGTKGCQMVGWWKEGSGLEAKVGKEEIKKRPLGERDHVEESILDGWGGFVLRSDKREERSSISESRRLRLKWRFQLEFERKMETIPILFVVRL